MQYKNLDKNHKNVNALKIETDSRANMWLQINRDKMVYIINNFVANLTNPN